MNGEPVFLKKGEANRGNSGEGYSKTAVLIYNRPSNLGIKTKDKKAHLLFYMTSSSTANK
jgi:hypothetical protein